MLGKVSGKWGTCEYFLKDEYVGRSMHTYGEYGPDETEKILELRGSGLFLDVGANIGCISQAVIASGGRVLAFEPQLEVYDVLCRNLAHTGSNWEAMNVAVGKEEGVAQISILDYSAKNNIGGLSLGLGSNRWGKHREVPVITLDGLNLKERVTFIKIDVEGYEEQVLRGAKNLIARDKPVLYVEDDRVENSYALRTYIRELGYSFEMHQPYLYRENNFFGHKRNVWKAMYASHNLICKPVC